MYKFIATFKRSITIPGDERSRQSPGHGYPEEVLNYTEVVWFTTEKELMNWIEDDTEKDYQLHEISELHIEVEKATILRRSDGVLL